MLQRYDVITEEILTYEEAVYADSMESARDLFIKRLKDKEYFGEAQTSMFTISSQNTTFDVMSGEVI